MSDPIRPERDFVSITPHASPITHHVSGPFRRLVPLACSVAALILVFVGLFDWDLPLTRFVRSLYSPVGSVSNPWLVQFSDLGDRLGKGESLVFLSLVLLAIGYGFTQQQWKDAGKQSLIAHGLVAVVSNILKHAIGRPRPKFLDTGHFEFSPVHGSGWDSFPSGHAAAAFAVVTVLATKFPRARWPLFAVATAIAVSRIVRGSHYLTDVAGGAALGIVVGLIAVHPWREWRASSEMAVRRMTPFFVALLAFIWTIVHLPSEAWPYQQLLWSGLVLTLAGLVGHVVWAVQPAWRPAWLSGSLTRSLLVLGIGMTTGSLSVTTAVLLVSTAHWLDGLQHQVELAGGHVGLRAALAEGLFIVAMLLALVASYVLKGIAPM